MLCVLQYKSINITSMKNKIQQLIIVTHKSLLYRERESEDELYYLVVHSYYYYNPDNITWPSLQL